MMSVCGQHHEANSQWLNELLAHVSCYKTWIKQYIHSLNKASQECRLNCDVFGCEIVTFLGHSTESIMI